MSEEIKTKKVYNRQPTLKQAKAIEILQENTGQPLGSVMIQAGYSPETARSPRALTDSKPFRAIFESKITNNMVLRAHKKLLNAKIKIRTYQKGEFKSETIMDDTVGLSKGVELAYKVKGAFAPIETKHTITGLESKSDDEIEELLREEERAIQRATQFRAKVVDVDCANVSNSEVVE